MNDFNTRDLPGLLTPKTDTHYLRLVPADLRFRFVCVRHRVDLIASEDIMDRDGTLSAMAYEWDAHDDNGRSNKLDFDLSGFYCPENRVDFNPDKDCATFYRVMFDLEA